MPWPLPEVVTFRANLGTGANSAPTDLAPDIVTLQLPVPPQAPLQPLNSEPAAGEAVSVTSVPCRKLAEHSDPQLIPEWWGDGTVVEEMDVRPGGSYRFRTAFGVVEGEFREVDPPERLVQTFQNHLQTLEFEDLGDQTKLTQTMSFATTEERDTTMQYGVEEGAKNGFARIDAVLSKITA